MLCTIALLKHIQIPYDISFGIYLREASIFFNLAMFRLKKYKRKDYFKIVAIAAKRKFDSEPCDSFVEFFFKCLEFFSKSLAKSN